MTLNPCNIPILAIPKRQVSSRRKVGIYFYVDSSLNRALVASTRNLEVIVIVIASTCPLSPIIKEPNFIRFLLKVTFSCISFRDPTRARFSFHKTHGHCPCSSRSLKSLSSITRTDPVNWISRDRSLLVLAVLNGD